MSDMHKTENKLLSNAIRCVEVMLPCRWFVFAAPSIDRCENRQQWRCVHLTCLFFNWSYSVDCWNELILWLKWWFDIRFFPPAVGVHRALYRCYSQSSKGSPIEIESNAFADEFDTQQLDGGKCCRRQRLRLAKRKLVFTDFNAIISWNHSNEVLTSI